MRKGFDGTQIVGVFSNLGAEGASYSLTLPDSGYTSGEVAVEILSCANVTVDASGDVAVAMGQGLPKVRSVPAVLIAFSSFPPWAFVGRG